MDAFPAHNGVDGFAACVGKDVRQFEIGKGGRVRPKRHREMGEVEDVVRERVHQSRESLVGGDGV